MFGIDRERAEGWKKVATREANFKFNNQVPYSLIMPYAQPAQVNVTWNDEFGFKGEYWVVQNGWDTVADYCAYIQIHSMGKTGTKKHIDIPPVRGGG